MALMVFDITRAFETRLADPVAYLSMLHNKLSKLRKAAEQFQTAALKASTHTNFQQAVKSMNVCVRELQSLSARGQELLAHRRPLRQWRRTMRTFYLAFE